MSERRIVARQRTFLKGRMTFNNGHSSEDCLVRDLSESGALIELPHPGAPVAFELLIPVRNLRAVARTAWRSGVRAGLKFEATESATSRPARALARLRDEGY